MKKYILAILLLANLAVAQVVNPSFVGPGGRPSTFTANGVLLGQGNANVVATSAGASGQCLLSGGAGVNPNWGSCAAGGAGTVTMVSVTPLNGLAGSVATPTTTPVITLSTSVSGVLKGASSAIVTALAGTDYSLGTAGLSTGIVKTTTGTGTLTTAVAADFPTLNQNTSGTAAGLSSTLAVGSGGTGLTATPANGQIDIGNGTNFTRTTLTQGSGITITNGSGSITIAASGGGAGGQYAWGDCTDGNVTTSTSFSLTRDMHYNNLTVSVGSAINTAGYRIFACGTLDISAAPTGAFVNNGNTGTTATTSSGAAGGATAGVGSVGTTTQGGLGGTGNNGANSTPGSVGGIGGDGGAAAVSGAGGTSTSGKTGGSGISATTVYVRSPWPNLPPATAMPTGSTIGAIASGAGGGGGGGGSSDSGSGTGSGGGGGGSGGGVITIFANTIARGTNINTSIFQVIGGIGGAGRTPPALCGVCTGGGGGSGGGGGWVVIGYATITGSSIANAIDISGGAGGSGGFGDTSGPAVGGFGGGSGGSGYIHIYNTTLSTVTVTSTVAGSAGSANTGSTGGPGASANTKRVAL